MTKIQVQKVFDTAQIASSRAFAELGPFFDYFNQFLDNTVRVLRKGIGLRDNVDCDIITTPATHETPFTQRVRAQPVGVVLLRSVEPVARPLFWVPDQASSSVITITPSFVTPTQGNNSQPTRSEITFVVYYS